MHNRIVGTLVVSVALVLPSAGAPLERRSPVRAVSSALAPLRTIEKTGGRISADGLTSTVVVKFCEGSDARVAAGSLELKGSSGASAAAAEILDAAVPGGVRSTFDRPAEVLRAEEARLEAERGIDLADLSLYVDVRTASPESAERLARSLERLDAVEFAYVRPAPLPPAAPLTPGARKLSDPPPDFGRFQYYLDRAPGGFGIRPVRDVPGGRGQGMRIVDIEYSWNLDHEDLPFDDVNRPFVKELGQDPFPEDKGSHGTAALGMLVGLDDDIGITGICPDAQIGVINPVDDQKNYRLAQAIDKATDILTRDGARGDIIQVEQQARGINAEIAALPPEWDPAVFDAIQRAIARGVIVIEPAGNGGIKGKKAKGIDLGRSELGGAFNRKKRDSGAIIVGGAIPLDANHAPTSNYGDRVDVQGYGTAVTTLGYGDLWGGNNPLEAYTGVWSGTSSATPCVTGVATIVQATLKANGLDPFDCWLLRALLVGTGSPDGSPRTQRVGPRPNAEAAALGVLDPAVPLITNLKFSKKRDELVVDGIYFRDGAFPVEERSIVYVNGEPVTTEYVTGYEGPYGTTTRIVAKNVGAMLPKNVVSYVTVGNQGGVVSPPRVYVRTKK